MSRVPYVISDIKKLSNIGHHLFRGLKDFNPENADKTRELVARVSSYADMHELRACAAESIDKLNGPISRSDIRLTIAVGLNQHFKVPMLDAWLRTGRARLPSLAIDQLTLERKREDRDKVLIAGAELKPGGMASLEAAHEWHEDQLRLFEAGAPSFDLVVWRDGTAFSWLAFIELYDAIRKSKFAHDVIDIEGLTAAGTPKTVDSYLREELIPQSRISLAQLIRGGLKVPHHHVVWLFSEEGECMGKAIRHTAHGGFVPRLFLNEEELCEGLSWVMRGLYLEVGSSKYKTYSKTRDPIGPVFTLKPGAKEPQPEGGAFDSAKVDIGELELVPNLFADARQSTNPPGARGKAWLLGGKSVEGSRTRSSSLRISYFESVAWLCEDDLPLLFPDRELTKPTAPDSFFGEIREQVFLPSRAIDFHQRAQSVLERNSKNAESWLAQATIAGVLANRCRATIKPDELELMVANVQLALGGAPGVDLSDKQALPVSDALVSQFPVLARYGALTLNAAALLACEGNALARSDLSSVELVDILKAVVMLQSAYVSSTPIRVFNPIAVDVAVESWFEGRIRIEQVQGVAEIYHRYSELLNSQQERIQAIDAALDTDTARRKEASDHRYAYVGKALPRFKPKKLGEDL